MRLDRPVDEGLVRTPGSVVFRLDQLRELPPAQHQRRQCLFGRRPWRSRHRPQPLAVERQRVGIEPIGFRQQTGGAGEIADLARIDHCDRDLGLLERRRQHALQATRGLDHHQQARLAGKPDDQPRNAAPVAAEAGAIATWQQVHIRLRRADIYADETPKLTRCGS